MKEFYSSDVGIHLNIILYLFHEIYKAYLQCLDKFRSEFLNWNKEKNFYQYTIANIFN